VVLSESNCGTLISGFVQCERLLSLQDPDLPYIINARREYIKSEANDFIKMLIATLNENSLDALKSLKSKDTIRYNIIINDMMRSCKNMSLLTPQFFNFAQSQAVEYTFGILKNNCYSQNHIYKYKEPSGMICETIDLDLKQQFRRVTAELTDAISGINNEIGKMNSIMKDFINEYDYLMSCNRFSNQTCYMDLNQDSTLIKIPYICGNNAEPDNHYHIDSCLIYEKIVKTKIDYYGVKTKINIFEKSRRELTETSNDIIIHGYKCINND